MSLSLALSSALSGISVTARSTKLVANNIANAQTPGYGVRSLARSSLVLGGIGNGVWAQGTIRHANPGLIAEFRNASAQSSQSASLGTFWSRIESGFGLPGDAGSLSDRLTQFETALQQASVTPDQHAVLQNVGQAAADIAQKLRDLSRLVQTERDTADAAIAQDIRQLNDALADVARLNEAIQRQTLLGGDPSGLIDQRQARVDDISTLIPVREFPREDGKIMLMGADGSILVDRQAAEFGFARSAGLSATDRVENGRLSAVMLNGRELTANSALFASGQIGSHLQVRDQLAPGLQDSLDMRAADLITRFASQDLDPSLAPGEEGIFISGGHFDIPSDITGLAGQIRLDARVDPGSSGATWRLRDGLNAVAPGAAADNSILGAMLNALNEQTLLPEESASARTSLDHATDLISNVSLQRLHLDQSISQASAKLTILTEALAAQGVDTDAELSALLILEQAYSANARVLATIDMMLRKILEI